MSSTLVDLHGRARQTAFYNARHLISVSKGSIRLRSQEAMLSSGQADVERQFGRERSLTAGLFQRHDFILMSWRLRIFVDASAGHIQRSILSGYRRQPEGGAGHFSL